MSIVILGGNVHTKPIPSKRSFISAVGVFGVGAFVGVIIGCITHQNTTETGGIGMLLEYIVYFAFASALAGLCLQLWDGSHRISTSRLLRASLVGLLIGGLFGVLCMLVLANQLNDGTVAIFGASTKLIVTSTLAIFLGFSFIVVNRVISITANDQHVRLES